MMLKTSADVHLDWNHTQDSLSVGNKTRLELGKWGNWEARLRLLYQLKEMSFKSGPEWHPRIDRMNRIGRQILQHRTSDRESLRTLQCWCMKHIRVAAAIDWSKGSILVVWGVSMEEREREANEEKLAMKQCCFFLCFCLLNLISDWTISFQLYYNRDYHSLATIVWICLWTEILPTIVRWFAVRHLSSWTHDFHRKCMACEWWDLNLRLGRQCSKMFTPLQDRYNSGITIRLRYPVRW